MAIYLQMAIVFVASLVVTLLMVPVSKRIASRIGAVDYPSDRRVNKTAIPRCGGIALYCGFMVGLLILYAGTHLWGWSIHNTYFLQSFNYPVLFLGVTAMFVLGLVDDVFQLSAGVKFLGQIVCAAIVVLSGVSIGSLYLFGQGFITLGWLDVPLTILYLVAFVNVTNLIDGLDGLAAGIVAICSIALMILVLQRGSVTLACVCVCLLAACIGFLFFNFNPASIFMGDSGALFLGFLLGIISLTGVVRMQSIIVLAIPIIIAGVPIIDTAAAIIRRLRNHQPISSPDMNHIHHRLMRSGFSQRKTVLVLYGITVVMVVIALLLSNIAGPARAIATAVVLVAGMVIVAVLGVHKPVLRHHYDNLGKTGPRRPEDDAVDDGDGAQSGADAK